MMRKQRSKLLTAVSFVGIIFLVVLYFYSLPEFLLSSKGSIFALVWLVFAAVMFGAHALTLFKMPRRIKKVPFKKQLFHSRAPNFRTRKNFRAARAMRG